MKDRILVIRVIKGHDRRSDPYMYKHEFKHE